MSRATQADVYRTIVTSGQSEEADDFERLQRLAADKELRTLADAGHRGLLMINAALLLVRAVPDKNARLREAAETLRAHRPGSGANAIDVLDEIVGTDQEEWTQPQMEHWSRQLALALLDIEAN